MYYFAKDNDYVFKNEDDNALYCGGFGVQYDQNGGKCGICGDPWHQFPRYNFTNNPFYNSLLYSVYFTLNTVGNYETGSTGLKIDAATSEVLHTF